MLISNGKKYLEVDFNDEDELEEVVESNYQQFFGPYALYLPKRKLLTSGNMGTIPDGVVIDIESKEWYIVEVERAVHGTWGHIAPQVSKHLTAVNNPETRSLILEHTMDFIKENDDARKVFDEAGIKSIDIRLELQDILKINPKVAIPIDSIPLDLQEWAQTLKNHVTIWTIDKYVNASDEQEIVYRLPRELTPTIETNPETGRTITVYELQGSELIVELIKQGYVATGDKLILKYKPRGGDQYTFEATILENGHLQIDDKIFSSSSYAAVYCYHKVGSKRETEDGLRKWKVTSGKTLEELRKELLAKKEQD